MSLSLFSRTALRASSSLAPAATATAGLRYFSQTALRAGDSSVVQAENEKAIATKIYKQTSHIPETTGDMNHNTPDYHAPVDHGTSTFSPVPKRVLDGSEGGSLPAAVLSGAPVDLQGRTVRIYKPAKAASQSGDWVHANPWRMDWDILQKGHRWENPMMGWQSSADEMQGTHIYFKSKEDAIAFAEKQGYEYFVQEPNEKKFEVKSYAANYLHEPKKLKYIKTK
ncbi:NADH dehydrogenase ubiquinone Fe-S protein 4, mitochondrial [Ascosphaera apis ARSEF 7405]|uniref:NADH dehydrogenase [ubiquinone] iron-sulfur protein 4, mitochondrial n=1 Tax=Ascosphaera apis ARSEF 7405 TaxID=392613 RepID=A0A167YEQ7_9EURO|nr:NADH dehydrogenase ubiquinone Fe-S protein 4, mitochondrial [Ascosphaera apis ARSEF 7405]